MTVNDQTGGESLGYCPAHTELVQRYGRDFGPFPGCKDCLKPEGFDPSTQYHLRQDNNRPAGEG